MVPVPGDVIMRCIGQRLRRWRMRGFRRPHWNHGTLKRQFAEELVRKRKLYKEKMNEHLDVCYEQRVIADYTNAWVSSEKAGDAMKRAEEGHRDH